MKITYWSDFNCPYSYLGLNRLTEAANELDLKPEWEMKSYKLTGDFKNTNSSMSPESKKEVEELAENEGLTINMKNALMTDTLNAHRLVKFAQSKNPLKSQKLIFKIFESVFSKNIDISQPETLCEIGKSVVYDENEIKKMLLSDVYEIEVAIDNEDARFNGIYFTPCYIITVGHEQLTVPGVFEKEDFKIALKDLLSGEIKKKTFL